MLFEVSGITVAPWLPPLVAFAISFVTSMAGISGAFLLLPFQMSVLGYVSPSPSVSATNLVFNLVAIPAGVWRYVREGRMDWRTAGIISAGTLPGLLAGWWLRVHWLVDARSFKAFAGMVLAALALKLLRDLHANAKPAPAADACVPARPVFVLALTVGVLFGLGGAAGMYAGARAQKHVPLRALEAGLALVLLLTAAGYFSQWLAR